DPGQTRARDHEIGQASVDRNSAAGADAVQRRGAGDGVDRGQNVIDGTGGDVDVEGAGSRRTGRAAAAVEVDCRAVDDDGVGRGEVRGDRVGVGAARQQGRAGDGDRNGQ